MNDVTVVLVDEVYHPDRIVTSDVNKAMSFVQFGWKRGLTAKFVGPFGERVIEPPVEDLVAQLPDESQERHRRNRARQKLP